MKRIFGWFVAAKAAMYLSFNGPDGRSGVLVFGRDDLQRQLLPFFLIDPRRAADQMAEAMRGQLPERASAPAVEIPSMFVPHLDRVLDLRGESGAQRGIDLPAEQSMVIIPPPDEAPCAAVFVHDRKGGRFFALVASKEDFRALAAKFKWDKVKAFAANRALVLQSSLPESCPDVPAFVVQGSFARAATIVALSAFASQRKSA